MAFKHSVDLVRRQNSREKQMEGHKHSIATYNSREAFTNLQFTFLLKYKCDGMRLERKKAEEEKD